MWRCDPALESARCRASSRACFAGLCSPLSPSKQSLGPGSCWEGAFGKVAERGKGVPMVSWPRVRRSGVVPVEQPVPWSAWAVNADRVTCWLLKTEAS